MCLWLLVSAATVFLPATAVSHPDVPSRVSTGLPVSTHLLFQSVLHLVLYRNQSKLYSASSSGASYFKILSMAFTSGEALIACLSPILGAVTVSGLCPPWPGPCSLRPRHALVPLRGTLCRCLSDFSFPSGLSRVPTLSVHRGC